MTTMKKTLLVLGLLLIGCNAKNPDEPGDAGICPAGRTDCDHDGTCETDVTTAANCGGCGLNCASGPHSTPTCMLGRCGLACDPGWGDCDGNASNGCESDLSTPGTCGSCGNSCASACEAGQCKSCDGQLALDSNDPMDAAKAMGLCEGVVSARWVMPDGSPPVTAPKFDLGHGILAHFGSNLSPREGGQMVAISSGTARTPTDPGYQSVQGFDKEYVGQHPMGFPRESPACPGVITGEVHDAIALELELKAPDWAKGFAFDFDFYTFEWPQFVCSEFNDFFVSLLSPIPAGQVDGNISFDPMGNPISVNSAFVSVCGCVGGPPCMAGGKTFNCSAGSVELVGTGFQETEDHAATSWLTTTAPVEPGATITLRLGIYDSGDPALDSTTLLDKFRWLPRSPVVGTEPIP
jgi:hypothetical protein